MFRVFKLFVFVTIIREGVEEVIAVVWRVIDQLARARLRTVADHVGALLARRVL